MINKIKKQNGLTLIELSIVLMILAALAVASTRFMFNDLDRDLADKTIAETWAITEYAVSYYSHNSGWPDQENDCENAELEMQKTGLLLGFSLEEYDDSEDGNTDRIEINSPWINEDPDVDKDFVRYTTSCDKDNPDAGFTVSLKIPDYAGTSNEQWIKYIHQKMPLTTVSDDGKELSTTMPIPAGIVALRDYLLRTEDPRADDLHVAVKASANDLKTAINMNTNKIVDFDITETWDHDIDPVTEKIHYTADTAKYYIDMQNNSVLSNIMIIPNDDAPAVTEIINTDSYQYYNNECDEGSAGGFALDVCEKDKGDEVYGGEYESSPDTRKSPKGSIKVNDIYLKSARKWGSEIFEEIKGKKFLIKHYSGGKTHGFSVPGVGEDDLVLCGATDNVGWSYYYEAWPKVLANQNVFELDLPEPEPEPEPGPGPIEGIPAGSVSVAAPAPKETVAFEKHEFYMAGATLQIMWTGGSVENPIHADKESEAYINVYCEKDEE